ncbi:MAG TPA: UDP-3-O-(3-hydroxymyristoyl)glucosamine N-acyltransferase, partial [Thermodesulfovibrionia bacterium]|nr:UDP-3-O-(3-hydroxymyristoyl)glucosamine N-acyltransferase [Thermodesulfovibrionia bacterium]
MKLSELAVCVQGRVVGDGTIEIKGIKGINEAEAGDITFISHNRYKKAISQSKASAVIAKEMIDGIALPHLLVNNPYYAFAKVLEIFHKKESPTPGISQKAYISPDAYVDNGATVFEGVYVGPLCHIERGTVLYPGVYVGEGSTIGEGTIIHPNVTIRENVTIGKNSIIHAGAVIGSDGFGYVFENGKHHKIPQVGGVVVEDNVEIGANVSIDRATLGNTIIATGTKIDNLVQIAHNVKIGQNCIIVAQTGISGSSVLGNGVIL